MPTPIKITELAALLNLDERRIQQLAKDGVIPKKGPGHYEIETAVPAYVKFLQDRMPNGAAASPDKVDYNAEKARMTKAQADMAEMERDVMRGELAHIEEFSRAQAMVMAALRQNVMNVPQRCVIKLLGCTDETEFKEILRDELTTALTDTANAEITDDVELDD